ncbi:MAG: DUF1080 domain-containing protein [Planctomycetota bacterium]|nr:DUF1080 domain-containing protein [Planctomycetota bacterium]
MNRFTMFRLFFTVLISTVLVHSTLIAADAKDEKWVSLFNGKDLTGWKTHPDDKAKWEVVDGMIVGTGPVGHLYSEKGDFKNFRYKLEVSISDKGNSGQYFRTKFSQGFPKSNEGLEAQINSSGGDKVRTGSLYNVKDCLIYEQLVKPDTFFTQEVLADGDHVVIKVNDKITVDTKLTGDKAKILEGHLAIQQHDPGSTVKIKKIEVIELP